MLLYQKQSKLQEFFNGLFKKKERMRIDFVDPDWGHVKFKWKGNAASGQNKIIGVLEKDETNDEKAWEIMHILFVITLHHSFDYANEQQ